MALEPITPTPPPMPGPVVARQDWRDVTFLHWRVDPVRVRPLLPPGLRIDTFDGDTFIGLIAFHLERARVGPLPAIPVVTTFTEINVRLLVVDDEGRRGVLFRSLEASRLASVLAARVGFGLPYVWSRTRQERRGDEVAYAARRMVGGAGLRAHVRVDRSRTADDPLAHFLTARWALFQPRAGRLVRLRNHHDRWPLHPAEAIRVRESLFRAEGMPHVGDRPPDSVLFSPGVDVDFALG